MASYRDLKVWQKAMDFVEAIYQETGGFPSGERLGLVSPPAYARLAEDVSHISRMLKALRTALRGSATPNPRNAA